MQSLIAARRRIPACQAANAADARRSRRDPARAAARAAARLGVDGRRVDRPRRAAADVERSETSDAGRRERRRSARPRHGEPTATPRLYAGAPLERPGGVQHRAGLLRPLGRATARASRCTGRTSPARAARVHVLGPAAARPTGCPTRSRRWASARGDKVALILPQRPETVVAHLAVYQLGAVAVPLSFLFGPDALEYRLDDSRGEGRVRRSAVAAQPRADPRPSCPDSRTSSASPARARHGSRRYESLRRAGVAPLRRRSTTRASDPALLVYTSGTTGPPKGALMPHRCLLGNLPGLRPLARRLSAAGRSVLVAGRLGVDRRPHGCAAADAVLRPADRRLPRALRSRARVAR